MPRWTKYSLDPSLQGKICLPIDRDAEAHAKTMGGYETNGAYQDKEALFKKYFFGFQSHRLEYYDAFLRRHLRKEGEILSLASGRCANELALIEEGYSITCSDIQSKELFPRFEFIQQDILAGPSQKRYNGWVAKHHGYRRTDREIIEPARQCGLELRHQENYAFTTEFQRSLILDMLIASGSAVKRAFSAVGKAIPSIRMFKFEKVA